MCLGMALGRKYKSVLGFYAWIKRNEESLVGPGELVRAGAESK